MRQFRCEHCNHAVYFHNDVCGNCGARLGFIPDERQLAAFSIAPDGSHLRYRDSPRYWRPCSNYPSACLCNWMVETSDPNPLCRSCRLTATIPDQRLPENQTAWLQLESAKRAWLYSILELHLPARSRIEDPVRGMAFHFLRQIDARKPVLTGHDSGDITINALESDPVQRERSRHELHEPYRTLLGHFRHESGHYYWDQLIRDTAFVEPFRTLFGDEREDYGGALKRHYAEGPRPDWQNGFVSGYATMHPWEDFAETLATYLDMVSVLDTAWNMDVALGLDPTQSDLPMMVARYIRLGVVLNEMNRAMGLLDFVPEVFTPPVVAKLGFVHDLLRQAAKP